MCGNRLLQKLIKFAILPKVYLAIFHRILFPEELVKKKKKNLKYFTQLKYYVITIIIIVLKITSIKIKFCLEHY